MKTIFTLRNALLLFVALILLSCASQYSNRGTAHDRTGTNGATNGNGKTPRTSAHSMRY